MTLRNSLPYYFRAVFKLAPPHYPQFGQLGPLFLDVKKLFCLISSNITITMRTHLWTLFIMMMFGCLCGDMNKQSGCALCIGSSQCLITDSHGPSLPSQSIYLGLTKRLVWNQVAQDPLVWFNTLHYVSTFC